MIEVQINANQAAQDVQSCIDQSDNTAAAIADCETEFGMSCPSVQGQFPESIGGLPESDVIVTGGCTTSNGTTYSGSFTATPTGVTYSEYSVTEPNEDCGGFHETRAFDGGYVMGNTAPTPAEVVLSVDTQELDPDDNCNSVSSSILIAANMTIFTADSTPTAEGGVRPQPSMVPRQ